jgi:hypothetical protein
MTVARLGGRPRGTKVIVARVGFVLSLHGAAPLRNAWRKRRRYVSRSRSRSRRVVLKPRGDAAKTAGETTPIENATT